MNNFPLLGGKGGDDKNLGESFAWGVSVKMPIFNFLTQNAFSCTLNTISNGLK